MDSLARSSAKAHRQPRNRLLSIAHDVQWVEEVHEAYGLERPLVPNERCGLWYVAPDDRGETCYFKSTDGHTGEWGFSTRRLNFHLLDLMAKNNGAIIVDSTRRGKTMPDALSKTVPIWCAVINYIMNYGQVDVLPEHNYFFWPRQTISANEANSIIKLIPQFAHMVMDLGLISPQSIREKLGGKILRPLWVYPGLSLPFEVPEYEDFIPVICCVASERADDGSKQMRADGTNYTYVQGAADDHELWAAALSPELFWKNFKELTNPKLSAEEMETLIEKVSSQKEAAQDGNVSSLKDVVSFTSTLDVGTVTSCVSESQIKMYPTVIILSGHHTFEKPNEKLTRLHFDCPSNKKGSNELRKHLPLIMNTIKSDKRCLILCDNGTDLSIGVALAVLASRYDLEWQLKDGIIVTKDVIKRQLAKILEKKKVNPSRATLQAINTNLM